MAKLSDKTKDELMHEALEYKMYRMSSEVKTANKVLMIKIDSEFGMLNERFNDVTDSIKSLIVRVGKLENDTEFIRASKRWKWVVGLAIIGLISTINFDQLKKIFLKFLP